MIGQVTVDRAVSVLTSDSPVAYVVAFLLLIAARTGIDLYGKDDTDVPGAILRHGVHAGVLLTLIFVLRRVV